MNLHSIKGLVMWYMHLPFKIKQYKKNNERNLARIRKKDKITVVFFASNVSMWRYQGLYDEMQKYPRFETHIVLSPLKNFDKEQIIKNFKDLKVYFKERNMTYHDFEVNNFLGFPVKELHPDIIFYPQPYYTVMTYKPHRYYNFNKSLLAYYPYGFSLRKGACYYDEDFHNRAWKRFYENEFTRKDCQEYSTVGDSNVEITGHAIADLFLNANKDVWKKQDRKKKRIIWAPHFTIFNDGWSQNSRFIEMADFMIDIAQNYINEIQIAFKPHPRLKSELYRHPAWGKEITDAYYQKWMDMPNTQLETGAYADLFMTSDGMIHDSGSFAAEYMYTGKPVIYTTKEMSPLYDAANELAKEIYNLHYIGKKNEDIIYFVEDVIIKEKDTLKKRREDLRDKYMLPPNGKTTAENTMNIIINSLEK